MQTIKNMPVVIEYFNYKIKPKNKSKAKKQAKNILTSIFLTTKYANCNFN